MRKWMFIPVAAMLAFAGCKPKLEGELGTPASKVEGISGTWQLSKFQQQDLNNPIKETRDLSDFYVNGTDTPYRITFSAGDLSYNVVSGPGRNYFGDSGVWKFDNNDYPTFLQLITATDTLQFDLGGVVRPWDTALTLELPRPCTDSNGNVTRTVIYKFEFTRVQ